MGGGLGHCGGGGCGGMDLAVSGGGWSRGGQGTLVVAAMGMARAVGW